MVEGRVTHLHRRERSGGPQAGLNLAVALESQRKDYYRAESDHERADMVDHGIQDSLEGERVTADLGQQQAALQRGQCCQGQLVGLCLGPKLAPFVHGSQPGPDATLPPAETCCHVRSSIRVELGQLAANGADGTSTLAVSLTLQLHQRVAPGPQPFNTVEAKEEVLLCVQDGLGLERNHRPHKLTLVTEVVIQLRAAHPRGRTHLFGTGAGDATLEDQLRRGRDNLGSGRLPLPGQTVRRNPQLVGTHPFRIATLGRQGPARARRECAAGNYAFGSRPHAGDYLRLVARRTRRPSGWGDYERRTCEDRSVSAFADLDLVPPSAELPEETDRLRAEIREFLAKQRADGGFVPHCDVWLSGWDERFSRELGSRGWLGMTLPVEYGGHGRSGLDRYVVTEELLAAGAPVAAHWIADRQIGPSLLRFGTEWQKQRYLPRIAAGECYFGIGMSEPDSGSDLASVRTKATRADGGWRLSGTKVWTSGAHHAHAFFALARSAPVQDGNRHSGLSQFIVELDSPGVDIRPIRLLTGAHHFNEVILDDVFVPDELVLGEIGAGWHQVTSELAYERSGPERFLSTFPLLVALVGQLAETGPDRLGAPGLRELGSLVARVWTLRQLSVSIAASLHSGAAADVPAALVKDLGTRYENEVIEAARLLVDIPPDPSAESGFARLLAEAVLHAPGFTLRGGTNEILRGVVARGMGLR